MGSNNLYTDLGVVCTGNQHCIISWLLTPFAIELREPCLATAENSHTIPVDRTLTYQTKGVTNGKFQVLVLFIFKLMLLQRVFKEADA